MTTYREAISAAMVDAMRDPKVVVLGQNVTTPHGVFGTTSEAARLYPGRCIEAPISETMLTGACVGLAMEGYKPILVHSRADFSLFSFEHLINTAAKLPWLHGRPIPFVMRCIVGRGWGQGPVHSQSWHHLLAQIPGLEVAVPVIPSFYRGRLMRAFDEGIPTVIFEPRRLYNHDLSNLVLNEFDAPDITIIAIGDTVLDAMQAVDVLKAMGIRPNVMVWNDKGKFEPAEPFVLVDMAPWRPIEGVVAPPFMPLGVAHERGWYPTADDIVAEVCRILGRTAPPRGECDGQPALTASAF